MASSPFFTAAIVLAAASRVSAHISLWDPSVFGFNESTAPHRLQDPLMNLPFSQWWMHGFLDKPPHPWDIMQLPVGGTKTTELSCDKGATSFYNTSAGGYAGDPNKPNSPCPGGNLASYHTNGINDLGGCALAVAYKSDANTVNPEDFTVFSVNQTCVWYRFTDFQIPKMMPVCPNGKCICAWFWMHRADSGSEQMYFTPFQCNMQGATSTKPLPPAQVARRCGPDQDFNLPAHPENCTYGAKQPLYWYQAERNNEFEDTYHPPLYTDLFHFLDGAQNDIFDPASYHNTSNLTSSSAMPTSSSPPSSIPLETNPSYSSSPTPVPDTHRSSPTYISAQQKEASPCSAESTQKHKPTSSLSGKNAAPTKGRKHDKHNQQNNHSDKDDPYCNTSEHGSTAMPTSTPHLQSTTSSLSGKNAAPTEHRKYDKHNQQNNHSDKDDPYCNTSEHESTAMPTSTPHLQSTTSSLSDDPYCNTSEHESTAMPTGTPHLQSKRRGEEPVHRDLGGRHRRMHRKRSF